MLRSSSVGTARIGTTVPPRSIDPRLFQTRATRPRPRSACATDDSEAARTRRVPRRGPVPLCRSPFVVRLASAASPCAQLQGGICKALQIQLQIMRHRVMLGVSSRRRYCCCRCPARSRDRRRWSAELAFGVPARGERRDPQGRVEATVEAEGTAVTDVVHDPAAKVLVEGSGFVEPGERASDARSERGRERERVGAGEVSTHISFMFVTAAVFQLLRGWLKASAVSNLASERATRGASVSVSVSVSASERASARRARSVPTFHAWSSPCSCPSYSGAG
jgi:hypothetical protein